MLLTGILAPVVAIGLPVSGLYSHEVPVASQSDSERMRAFREALSAVLVKVSGDPRWLESPGLMRALDSAGEYVEAINFRTATVTQAPAPDDVVSVPTQVQQAFINVVFARDLVDRLLINSAIPLWDSNRPSVLVWMVLQNDAGDRTMLSTESNPRIIEIIQSFARERGLPILFPVLDFEDRRNLSPNQIWSLDDDAIARASVRYGADSILAGRLHLTSSGDLVGLWQFQFQEQVEVFDGVDTDLQNYIEQPLARVTSQLASHFAILTTMDGTRKSRLRVTGIADLEDYSELINYLQDLGMVASVTVAGLQGNEIELELGLSGNPQQLRELIALDRDLQWIESATPGQVMMNYRWTR